VHLFLVTLQEATQFDMRYRADSCLHLRCIPSHLSHTCVRCRGASRQMPACQGSVSGWRSVLQRYDLGSFSPSLFPTPARLFLLPLQARLCKNIGATWNTSGSWGTRISALPHGPPRLLRGNAAIQLGMQWLYLIYLPFHTRGLSLHGKLSSTIGLSVSSYPGLVAVTSHYTLGH